MKQENLLNNKVSLKNLKKQILEKIKEVKAITIKDLYSIYFPKNGMELDVFFGTYIVSLINNDDIEILNVKENISSLYNARNLGTFTLKLKERND